MTRSKKLRVEWLLGGLLVFLVVFVLISGAVAQEKIKIGVSGPMKFQWGKSQLAAAQVAAEEINASGGILLGGKKRQIELINSDSNEYQSVVDAVSSLKRLVTVDKVNFLIGGARSEAVLAQQELLPDYRTIYLFCGGGSPALHASLSKSYDKYKYFFNMFPVSIFNFKSNCAVLEMAAGKIRRELGVAKPRVAIVMEKAKWTDAVVDASLAILPKLGMEISGVWRPSAFASDVSSEITALKAAGTHIIYEMFTGPAGMILNKQVSELQVPVVVIGVNAEGEVGNRYWKETQGMCEYETIIAAGYSDLQVTEKTIPAHNKIFSKLGGLTPTVSGFMAYDAVYLIKDAVEKAGTLENDALIAQMEKSNLVGTQGMVAFYPKDHKLCHNVKWAPGYYTIPLFQFQGGKMAGIWPSGHSPNAAIEAGPGWEGFRYKGTQEFKLPPRMVKYWKK